SSFEQHAREFSESRCDSLILVAEKAAPRFQDFAKGQFGLRKFTFLPNQNRQTVERCSGRWIVFTVQFSVDSQRTSMHDFSLIKERKLTVNIANSGSKLGLDCGLIR